MAAFKVIILFVSTYICEHGFSTLVQIKTKARNKLGVQDYMRLAISHIQPRVKQLCSDFQAHPVMTLQKGRFGARKVMRSHYLMFKGTVNSKKRLLS